MKSRVFQVPARSNLASNPNQYALKLERAKGATSAICRKTARAATEEFIQENIQAHHKALKKWKALPGEKQGLPPKPFISTSEAAELREQSRRFRPRQFLMPSMDASRGE